MDSNIKTARPGGEKVNPEAVTVKSTKDGRIELGHLHLAGEDGLSSDVTAGVYLEAYDSTHYMSMDIDGPRTGWTLNRCPGPYEINCASKTAGIIGDDKGIGYFLLAENGDIVIRAPKGRIRLSALDIDISATGPNNTRGSVNIDSNQSVNVDTPVFNVTAGRYVNIFSKGIMDVVANHTLNMTGNFINNLTGASRSMGSKTNPTSTQTFTSKQSFNS